MLARGSPRLLLVLVAVAVAFAGCAAAPSLEAVEAPHSHGDMKGFRLEAEGCVQGGGVSTYAGPQTFADTYESSDIGEEVNSPYPKSNPTGVMGEQWANWHMGFRCESATVNGETQSDYIFGYVGQNVKPPAWDPGGADFHFILTGLAFGNGTFADALRATTTADITHAYRAVVDWYVPKDSARSAAYVEFSDVEKGVYMQYSNMEHYRAFEPRTVRFWWGVPDDGSQSHAAHDHNPGETSDGIKWHPVYFDLTTTGGHQYTTPPGDRVQMFCHLGNDDHGPTPLGGVCEPTHTVVYEHESLTFTYGGLVESVTLPKLHVH